MKKTLFLSLLCVAASVASCKKDTPADPETTPVTGVTLNKTEVSVQVGNSETLIATVAPDAASDKEVTWSSSDTSKATVDDGIVTGVKAGEVTITVITHDGGKTATCAVTVTAPESNPYTSNVSLPASDNSMDANYVQQATIDGTECFALKLGTSSKVGRYTTNQLPVTGNCTLMFYGVSYQTKSSEVLITVNGGGSIDGGTSKTVALKPNSGFSGNPPYTLTLGADDLYSCSLTGITEQTSLTFESQRPTGGDYRALLAGINVN